MAAAAVVGAAHGGELDWTAPSAEAAVVEVLGRRGLLCAPDDVTWLDAAVGPHRGLPGLRGAIFGRSRAIVRARSAADPSAPSDLYLVDGRRSSEGVVLWVGDVWDLTNTSGVDESRPRMRGAMAAYATSGDGLVTGVHVLDLAGPASDVEADFTWLQRAQAALTNYQQTGQMAGVAHTTFALEPVAAGVDLAWRGDGQLEVHADDRVLIVDPGGNAQSWKVVRGAEFVRVVLDERVRPGSLVPWAVDRLRAFSWVGDDRMQWVKAVAFTALDKLRVTFSHGTTAEEVRDEIGIQRSSTGAPPRMVDPEIGWPPAPLKLAFARPLTGEGEWIALDKDPFITPTSDGGAPAFVTSFVRPNVQRGDVRVYVTLWDPRQVALHVEAGTVEPVSVTGEHGSGLIPRAPEVMDHVVAAFNGGFQSQHGEYGMQADGIEYLPPKPYAATVVERNDGENGFGAWPADAAIPDDVIGLRQNLTALVQNGKFNPWGRSWWGGAPPGWPDQIHTARSAICLTSEGFVGYFYSSSISAEDLAAAMLTARCSFGIHLDMNVGHAGFEFYDVARDERFPSLGRSLQSDWEATGKVPGMPGYSFRARRMIRGMGHMLFPRYIQREARDFFYLTSRSILPGAPIPPPLDSPGLTGEPRDPTGRVDPAPLDDGRWRTSGLPQHGFPFAVAMARARAYFDTREPVWLRILRADPRTLRPASNDIPSAPDGPTVLSFVAPAAPSRAMRTLWWRAGSFTVDRDGPGTDGTPLLGGCATTERCAAASTAELGVQDEDGVLVWVELPPSVRPSEETGAAMSALLSRLGCSARMAIPGRASAWIGGDAPIDAGGDPIPSEGRAVSPAVRFVRAPAPGAQAIFADTPIVPAQVWQPLQSKRGQVFRKPTATLPASPASSGH